MRPTTTQVVLVASGTLIGSAFLWLAWRFADPASSLAVAAQADLGSLALIAAATLSFMAVKTLRWRFLLPNSRVLSRDLLAPVFIGATVNYALPHLGELARVWFASRRGGIPKMTVLTSIAVERVFDFFAIVTLGALMLLVAGAHLDSYRMYLLLLAVPVFALGGAAVYFAASPGALRAVTIKMVAWLPLRLRPAATLHAESVAGGLAPLAEARVLSTVVLLSLVQWGLMVVCAYASFEAVGVPVPVEAAYLVILLLTAGLVLPAAPGHVGTTQVAFLAAAVPFGVQQDLAVAVSIVYNVAVPGAVVVGALPALVALRRRGRSADTRDARLTALIQK